MARANDIDCGALGAMRATRPASPIAAGPFDISPSSGAAANSTLPDALITGLLVGYPVLATVVALVVGLSLSGPVA